MFCGKIPVTPIVETQLSQIAARQFLHQLRLLLLQQLKTSTIDEGGQDHLVEVLCTGFILLKHIELATAHERKAASTCRLIVSDSVRGVSAATWPKMTTENRISSSDPIWWKQIWEFIRTWTPCSGTRKY